MKTAITLKLAPTGGTSTRSRDSSTLSTWLPNCLWRASLDKRAGGSLKRGALLAIFGTRPCGATSSLEVEEVHAPPSRVGGQLLLRVLPSFL